jgi:hypothetical protein
MRAQRSLELYAITHPAFKDRKTEAPNAADFHAWYLAGCGLLTQGDRMDSEDARGFRDIEDIVGKGYRIGL